MCVLLRAAVPRCYQESRRYSSVCHSEGFISSWNSTAARSLQQLWISHTLETWLWGTKWTQSGPVESKEKKKSLRQDDVRGISGCGKINSCIGADAFSRNTFNSTFGIHPGVIRMCGIDSGKSCVAAKWLIFRVSFIIKGPLHLKLGFILTHGSVTV